MTPNSRAFLSLGPLIAMAWLGTLADLGAASGESAPFQVDTRNCAQSTPPFTVNTRAPDVIANTGISDPGGTSFPITMAMLHWRPDRDGRDHLHARHRADSRDPSAEWFAPFGWWDVHPG